MPRDLITGEDADGSAAQDAREGQILSGKYRLLRRLSAGGMGTVYQARALDSGRDVAIKILHAEFAHRPRVVQRFVREANIAAGLASEHVVGVKESGEAAGVPYLVMDLLQGQDLRQLLRREGQLATARAVSIILDACEGARAAHEARLVHRDLKPANIFITRRADGRELAKILDFGVAKLRDLAESTGEGSLIGTVGYMAPEQVISARSVDHRADIFALGLILREALCGEPLRHGERAEVLFRALYADVPPLRAQRPDIPEPLDAAVLRAIARDPEGRYPSVVAFADALRPFARADSAVALASASLGQRGRERSSDVITCADSSIDERRRPVFPMAATLPAALEQSSRRRLRTAIFLGALAVAGVLWLARGLGRSSPPRPPPLSEAIAASTPALPASSPSRGKADTPSLHAAPQSTSAPAPPAPVAPQAPKLSASAPRPSGAHAAPAEAPFTLPGVSFDATNPYQSPPLRAPATDAVDRRPATRRSADPSAGP